MLKASGIWGSGLDTLLTGLREVIQGSDKASYPDAAIRKAMDSRGKTLTFTSAEIEDLLELEYGDRRVFPLLSLLFPFVDLRNHFHVDHVFPDARFTIPKLRAVNSWAENKFEGLRAKANQLPNLQLLEGTANNEKRTTLPAEWLASRYLKPGDRTAYCMNHLLGEVPEAIKDCEGFWDARRERLRERITQIVNVAEPMAVAV